MPDGKFTKNTRIEYCCCTDEHAENDIILPTDTPFVLFKSNSHQRQHVQGMCRKEEWFPWDRYRRLVFLWKRKNGICSV